MKENYVCEIFKTGRGFRTREQLITGKADVLGHLVDDLVLRAEKSHDITHDITRVEREKVGGNRQVFTVYFRSCGGHYMARYKVPLMMKYVD